MATLLTVSTKQHQILHRFYPSQEKIYTNIVHEFMFFFTSLLTLSLHLKYLETVDLVCICILIFFTLSLKKDLRNISKKIRYPVPFFVSNNDLLYCLQQYFFSAALPCTNPCLPFTPSNIVAIYASYSVLRAVSSLDWIRSICIFHHSGPLNRYRAQPIVFLFTSQGINHKFNQQSGI